MTSGSRTSDPLRAAERGGDEDELALPPPPNMYTFRHFGMYMSYLCVGFIYGSALAFIYPIVVILNGGSPNYSNAVQNLLTTFWSFKVFFGMLSDNVPLFGYRRKPYLLIGWSFAIAASVILAVIATINGTVPVCCPADGDDCFSTEEDSCPSQTPGTIHQVTNLPMNTLILFMVINNFGYVLGDVAMDSMAIDYAKREAPENRGEIQGMCYTMRSAGFVVSNAITGFGLNGPVYGGTFSGSMSLCSLMWVVAGLQALGLPWWIAMKEDKYEPAPVTDSTEKGTLARMWELLNNSAYSKLMLFNVAMNASQVVVVAARNQVLHYWVGMDALTTSVDNIIGYFLQMLTLFAAAKWLKAYNWRGLLIFGTAYFIFFMFMFWLVVFDVTRNPWLVVLIDADQTFAQSVGYLVVMWACVEMAPTGMEGTTLALTTTVGNAGQSLGNYVTIALNAFFALSVDDLKTGKHSRATEDQYMYNAITVMVLQCAFMVLFPWMPTSMAHSKALYKKARQSKCLATCATVLVCFAVLWGAGTNVFAVICPDNSIIGGDAGIGKCKVTSS